MNLIEFFNSLMEYPHPTRIEVLEALEILTRNYEPKRVTALIADFADMLYLWKCEVTYNRAKLDYEENERKHRAEYDDAFSEYERQLNIANYQLVMGTNDPIQWPEEPQPYIPLQFIPPMPGTIVDNIHIPAIYDYAVEVLRNHTSNKQESRSIPPSLSPDFTTKQAQTIFRRLTENGYCMVDGDRYKWEKSTALLAYCIDEMSRILALRPSNDRIPWSKFAPVFGLDKSAVYTCRNEVSKYTKKYKDKPEGWRELDPLLR